MLGIRQKFLLGLVAAFVSINSTEVAHAYQVFNNREEWEAALSRQAATFDFSNLAGEDIPSGTVLPNGLTVSYLASETPGGATVSAMATATGVSITSTREIGSGPLLGLPSSVQAVGFDVTLTKSGMSDAGFLIEFPTLTSSTNGAGGLKFPIIVSEGQATFFGFISDPGTSFNEVDVRCQIQDCLEIGGVAVDNISDSPLHKHRHHRKIDDNDDQEVSLSSSVVTESRVLSFLLSHKNLSTFPMSDVSSGIKFVPPTSTLGQSTNLSAFLALKDKSTK